MSRTKDAYLKYISISKSKYIVVTLNDGKIIRMSLKPERFPHLIGIQYISKYKKIPANSMNLKILANDVLDNKTVDSLPKQIKSLLKRKSKAIIENFDVENAKYAIPAERMTIGIKVTGDLFMISQNQSKTKYFIITFNIDRLGIAHPISAMQTNLTDKKIHQLDTLKWKSVKNIEHVRTLKF